MIECFIFQTTQSTGLSSVYFDLKFVLTSVMDVLILNTNLAVLGESLVMYFCLSRNSYFKFLSFVLL